MSAKMKFISRQVPLADAISEAFGELASLGEELREAYDNTPESLQQSGVGEARGEAADTLEGISEPDMPTKLQDEKLQVSWGVPNRTPKQQSRLSRRERRDDAIAILSAAIDYLGELAEDEKQPEAIQDAAHNLADEIEQA